MATKQKSAKGKRSKDEAKAGIIIGASVLAAAASAYYLYGSKDAAKNRKAVKGWVLKAKGEVIEKLENLKDANEDKYNAVVDAVAKKYATVKSIDPMEVEALRRDLRRHWKNFQKDFTTASGTAKRAKRTAKKTGKKTVKSVAKAKKAR